MPIGRRRGIVVAWLAGFALAWLVAGCASAQDTVPAASGAAAPISAKSTFATLNGTWIRPDGGYRIEIARVASDGQIAATYFNPNRLPFAKALATMDGATLRAAFELQAGGYAGSTYDLAYDPVSDRLKGVYYQAVAKQKFDVYFVRK